MERSLKPVLVVSHQAPNRLLRAYLLGLPLAPSLHDDGTCAEIAALADGATVGGAPCILALSPLAQEIKLSEQAAPPPPPFAHTPLPTPSCISVACVRYVACALHVWCVD